MLGSFLRLGLLGLRWSRIARELGLELGWLQATTEYALSLLGADSKLPAPGHLDAAALAARHACFSELRTARLDNCGHNLHHDRPEAVAEHLQALLAP